MMNYMLNIKELKNTKIPDDYYGFSVKDFIESKTLRIENVKTGIVQGKKCIKVDVRVIKDKDGFTDDEGHFTPYNEGKVFTLRVENEDMDMFDVQLAELKQSIGHFIEFDPFEELIGVYFYQQNILTIIISDFKTGEADKDKIITPQMKDRPLKKLSEYRQFDIEDFLENESLRLKGMRINGKKHVIFNGFIDNENMISIDVTVDNAEELPSELITIDTDFVASIKKYDFNNVATTNYGTRWTFYFNSLTIQPGVVSNNSIVLGEPIPNEQEVTSNQVSFSPEQI